MRINVKGTGEHEEKPEETNVRLPPSLKERLDRIAEHRAKSHPEVKRSRNATIVFGLERFAESYEKANGIE